VGRLSDEPPDTSEYDPNSDEKMTITMSVLATLICWIPIAGWLLAGLFMFFAYAGYSELSFSFDDKSKAMKRAAYYCFWGALLIVVTVVLYDFFHQLKIASFIWHRIL
jgi:uncharacterized membrane protein